MSRLSHRSLRFHHRSVKAHRSVIAAVVLFLLLMVALAAQAPDASARSYYVSPGGSDARTCDLPAAPCQTINQALVRAKSIPGTHTINVAARHNRSRAVYREPVLVRGSILTNPPKIVIDGSWRANGKRALIAPRGSGHIQVVSLDLPGAQLRNIDIDARQSQSAKAALVLQRGGSNHVVRDVKVDAGPDDVGVVVEARSSMLQWVTIVARGSVGLDYAAEGDPVLVADSAVYQEGSGVAIRGSGTSSMIFRRSIAWTSHEPRRVIRTEGGRLFLDSSLVSGGTEGAIHLGGPTGPSLRSVSSTIDAGSRGRRDPDKAAVTLATGGNAEVEIIGSIVVEPPLITVVGSAEIECSETDIPSTSVSIDSPPQTIGCKSGTDGNTHSDPAELFAGDAPFSELDDYRLRAGVSAINTGPYPAPSDATEFDLVGQARVQPPGTCGETDDRIDKGAIEFGCTATDSEPRPPTLRETFEEELRRPGGRGGSGRDGSGRRGEGGFGGGNGRNAVAILGHRVAPRSRHVKRGGRIRVAYAVNRPALVMAVMRAPGRSARGRAKPRVIRVRQIARKRVNVLAMPTRRLRPRARPYALRMVAFTRGERSNVVPIRFRVVPPRARRR